MEFEDFKSKICSTDGGAVYIVFSTENHLVNYIPLVLADAVGKVNMKYCTIKDSSKNETWDKRFTDFYRDKTKNTEEIKSHKFSRQQILGKKKFKESIENAIGSSTEVFWNFTGGQRIWILSALPYIIEDDKENRNHHILYVEGNEEQLKVVSYLEDKEPKNESFSFKDSEFKLAEKLELNDLFSFMDFESIKSNSYYEKGELGNKFCQLIDSFQSFFDGYVNLLDNEDNQFVLLDKLIDLNREKIFSDLESFKDTKFEWAEVKAFIDSELGEDEHGVPRIEKKGTKLFGYILEYLVLYKICHLIQENDKIKERIAGLWHSVKISDTKGKGYSNVDEFDILILTTGGKVIVLECKSGKMSGDVAKSTNYSTYAIAGVYGMPLFSSPLLSSMDLYGEKYKTIRQAHNSAKRARLDILYIDEIEEKLKELLNITK